VITNCEFSKDPSSVEVASNVIDPDFCIDIWRPSPHANDPQVGAYERVCRVGMPLIVGRNKKIFHESLQCQAGDVLGWYSPNEIDLRIKEGEGIYVKCYFPSSPMQAFNRPYCVRAVERAPFWDDVQAAVKNFYQEEDDSTYTEMLLSIANRKYFSGVQSMSAVLDYEKLKGSLTTENNVINQNSLQSLIDSRCQQGPTQTEVSDWQNPPSCYYVKNELTWVCTYTRTITKEYGFNVRRWIIANQATFLRDATVGTWCNEEHVPDSKIVYSSKHP
jgi:hypothetical protein